MYMYVYVCICICMYMYVYVCICMYMCVYVYICIYIYTCLLIHSFIHLHSHTFTYAFACIHIDMHARIYVQARVCNVCARSAALGVAINHHLASEHTMIRPKGLRTSRHCLPCKLASDTVTTACYVCTKLLGQSKTSYRFGFVLVFRLETLKQAQNGATF